MARVSALKNRFLDLSTALSVCEERFLTNVERAALHQIVVLQKLRNVCCSHGVLSQVSAASI